MIATRLRAARDIEADFPLDININGRLSINFVTSRIDELVLPYVQAVILIYSR